MTGYDDRGGSSGRAALAAHAERLSRHAEAAAEAAVSALAALDEADFEATRSTLTEAARRLADPRVAAAWIATAARIRTPALLVLMIERLGVVDPRRLTGFGAWLALLERGLALPAARRAALEALGRTAPFEAHARRILVGLWAADSDPDERAFASSVLLGDDRIPEDLVPVFLEREAQLPDGEREVVIARLVAQGSVPAERWSRWLGPAESAAIRSQVIEAAHDLVGIDEGLWIGILGNDPAPENRLRAALVLLDRGIRKDADTALVDAAIGDADPEVRAVARRGLRGLIRGRRELLPRIVDAVLNAVDPDEAASLVDFAVQAAAGDEAPLALLFSERLQDGLRLDLALVLAAGLAGLTRRPPEVASRLEAALAWAGDLRLRTALLRALASGPLDPAAKGRVAILSLQTSDPEGQAIGLRLLLGLLPAELPTASLAAAAAAVRRPEIPVALRREVVGKLALLPELPPEVCVHFDAARREQDDPSLREAIARAESRAEAGPESRREAARWRRRLEVEHDPSGVFPSAFCSFDDDPEAWTPVLVAALASEVDLYPEYGYAVTPIGVARFLAARGRGKDAVARLAERQLRDPAREGTPDPYLGLLGAVAEPGAHRDLLLAGFEWRNAPNPTLLRVLLSRAFGGEAAAIAAVLERAQRIQAAASVVPYARWLAENLVVDGAEEALATLAARADAATCPELQAVLEDASRRRGRPFVAAPAAGPGFADE